MTRIWLHAALFWVATAAIVPVPSSAQRSDTKRENLTRGNAADSPQTPKKGDRMGVFVELRDDKTPREIAGLGLGWVRIMYNWTWLEPSKDQYNWVEFDQWIARAKAHRLKVLAVAQGSPAWANGGHGPYDKQSGLNTPPLPEFSRRFAEYAADLVRHGADAVEIWNEPNGGFWLQIGRAHV